MTTIEPLPDTLINRVFRAASLCFVGLQGLNFIRHTLQPVNARDFNAEPFFAVAVVLLTQIIGCGFALGAGKSMLACMIANIASTVVCLSLLWFF